MIDFEFEFQYAEEKQPALQKIGGSIPAGCCVVLCGGSGCGKSTLLRCINGLIPQFYEGELKGFCLLNGQDTAGMRIGEIGELVASVFQYPRSQFFTVNSSNEVAFGLENHGLLQGEIRRRVDDAFRIFHLERLKDRSVYELSGGERQLISILSAWAMDTDIFLLDEPTANLDFSATRQLRKILLALKQQGKTLLLSEYRLYYLTDIADEYWVMADGEIKGKYTAAKAKAFSAEQRQAFSLRTLDLAKITVPEKEPLPKTASTALDVSDVRYSYGRKAGDTLSGVSFSVREHEIVVLVGANGCGKTTIGKLAALRNLHLLERLIMIVAVIFRFFPVLSGDMKLLRQSIRTRGAFATPLQKLRALPSYLEILTVPMALRVIRIAKTLSASAETRGIDLKRRKSNYLSLRFSAWDVVFCVLLAA
ncbi:MAG: ATP-binding cassette domain-containing protein [Clostridiales bacterium]|nr:ATP-binding cassette domain-containing protein [Clostridiales bacterium]